MMSCRGSRASIQNLEFKIQNFEVPLPQFRTVWILDPTRRHQAFGGRPGEPVSHRQQCDHDLREQPEKTDGYGPRNIIDEGRIACPRQAFGPRRVSGDVHHGDLFPSFPRSDVDLTAFQNGSRRNDAEAQMRNMVRAMTADEIDQVATFYARKAAP